MNKKLSVFAIILIIVGLIGLIWSVFFSMPYFINKLQAYSDQINKEHTIYEKNINVNELNIDTNYINMTIVKSNSDKIKIKSKGLYENVDIDITNNNGVLSIREIDKKVKSEKIKGIDDFVSKVFEKKFSNYKNMITVNVPNNINLEAAMKSGSLKVEGDIFLDNFSFNTSSGNLLLPKVFKNLEKLSINSQGYVSLQLAEILGIKEVNIYSSNVYIGSNETNLQDIEKYLPEKLAIKSNNLEEGDIDI
ncbi:hypothetical protein [Terrisporobacter sp.]